MTTAELKVSAEADNAPPAELGHEARALWFCKAGRWDEAHIIAQDIHTPLGSWIHALLHLLEGDESNARYWFARADRPAVDSTAIDAEWERMAAVALGGSRPGAAG